MKNEKAGNRAETGFWWNRSHRQVVVLSGEGGTLPGEPGTSWVRIPLPAMIVAAPILGALYVVALPFIGLATLIVYAGRRVTRSAKASGSDLAATVGSEWRPGESWFTRRPKGDGKKQTAPDEPKK